MVKVRSKLKRHSKGKTWSKGHSSTSNPEQMKHRSKATSQFFQPNLKIASSQTEANDSIALTIQALAKHDQQNAFKKDTATINEVAQSLKSCNLLGDDDDEMSGTHQSTFHTFATNYTMCSNMSFKKLLLGFRINSELHKEMLAILTALAEIIKERGGTESTTEYFLLLMEQIEASAEDKEIIAGIALLAMGIKTVPAAVLRKRFAETAQTLMTCMQTFMESPSNQNIIKNIMTSLSILLRAQEMNAWACSSTWQYIDALLAFTIHSKPKIRRAAQHAVIAIINGSCFMCPSKKSNNEIDYTVEKETMNTDSDKLLKSHPASNRVTKFCLNKFQPELLANQPTTVLHTLMLLRGIISSLKADDIRTICEHLLSIISASNVLIRTNCLQVLHSLFISRTKNLNALVCAKLLAAIHEYRPDVADINQTAAWLTVLKEGHIHLAKLDLNLCLNSLPRLFNVCIEALWLKSHDSSNTSVIPNCIKELLYECIKPACTTEDLASIHNVPINHIINDIHKMLNIPLESIAKYAVLTFAILFETCGKYFINELMPSLLSLAQRYDTQNSLRIHIEHTMTMAVKYLGVENVLKAVPLTNSKNEIQMDRTWLLPLLREGTTGSTFKFFKNVILPLALDCNIKWHKYAKDKQSISLSHTYELLCCQLWGLLPGFCRQPKDPENFALIAPTLGNALENNVEFRAPIFDAFVQLAQNDDTTMPKINELLIKYAKNFLPRLFNIYTQKPNGTYEQDLRVKCLEVIQIYLAKTSKDVLKELYDAARKQLHVLSAGSFQYIAIYDIIAVMVPLQSSITIKRFFENYVVPILMQDKTSKLLAKDDLQIKKQQRQTYQLLKDILTSELKSCQEFTQHNLENLQKLLLDAFTTSCSVCQAARLRCLLILVNNLNYNHELVLKAIPEAIINYREFCTRKENVSLELLKRIVQIYHNVNKLNDLVDILTAGFVGDDSLITNTIFAFRTILQDVGKHLTVKTLEFILEQIAVFVVQRSRSQARASIAFLITFIRTMPSPFIGNYLEIIMKSLSAMVKDTKRYCRIEIGYLLKKLCKRFTAEELNRYVPGDDEITHKRLKKIRKQLRRYNRRKQDELDKEKNSDDELSSDEEFIGALGKKSVTIEDILAESDSDILEDNDIEDESNVSKKTTKTKKNHDIYIREDPEEENIVDFIDIKSIGNISTNKPHLLVANSKSKMNSKSKDINRGFKTAPDGRLIISNKGAHNMSDSDDDDDNNEIDSANNNDEIEIFNGKEGRKRLADHDDSSDDQSVTYDKQKRKAIDTTSLRSHYITGGKGIHRPLGHISDTTSMKSGKSSRTQKSVKSSNKSQHTGAEYRAKKAKGDVKKKGKLDPYAYIPLNRSSLNKRKQAKCAGTYNNIIKGARKGALRGVKNKLTKRYK